MIGVIADDLTGAAELGAVALRHGLRAEVIASGKVGGDADVICMDTDSRSCPAEEAGRRAAAAAGALTEAGASWIYKKVDSVLRGQVTAELEAMMKQLRLKRALLVPANPALGRTVKGGRYLIRGKPIHETEFARDPEHPRTSAKVLELLGPPKSFSVRVCEKKDSLPGAGIIVGEAARVADLQQWAARRTPAMLAAGASGFFTALLAQGGATATVAPADSAAPGTRELFVCGTLSRSARDFLSAARARRTPIFLLPAELAWSTEFTRAAMEAIAARVVAALRVHPRVILNIGLPSIREAARSRLLVGHLVQLAVTVLRQVDVGHVYAEGGATAATLVREMDWKRFTVVRELAPGVATLAVKGHQSLRLTIKPGSYVWPAEIQNEIGADCPVNA